MLKSLSLAFVAGIALSVSAHAEGPAVQSGNYTLEPTHTEVMFGVGHFGFSTYYGQFPGTTGSLKLDSGNPAASQLDVSVPVANVWTASDKLTDELKSADWLDAKAFPAMTFHSTKITPTGPTTADVAGDLTLHGVTKPVVLHATFMQGGANPMDKKYELGFAGSAEILRSEFGIKSYVPAISDKVTLTLEAEFKAG